MPDARALDPEADRRSDWLNPAGEPAVRPSRSE
jgi:hypothetical protein